MDNFASSALIGGLITYCLPIEDNSIKMQIGLIGSQLLTYILNKGNFNFINYFKKRNNELIICSKAENIINPIYYQVEEYFIKKYISEIKNLQLIAKNGEITFSSCYNESNKNLEDNFKNEKINLTLNAKMDESNDKKSDIEKNPIIKISSDKGCLKLLKEYVEFICESNKPQSSVIKIFKIRVSKSDKFTNVNWDTIYVKTNKNFNNTIVNENIKVDLYDDIEYFINNEKWFTDKGIPYKRGYLLYGPPGTGKTSIVKAISNTYQLPIFNLDLSSVKSNVDLLKLVTDINYLSNNQKYIVTIEDIDRCPLFSTCYDRHRQLENNTLSIDCLLNVLDGIIETHGRIFFMSANDLAVFDRVKDVLFRPGRIDKKLHITYCTNTQVSKIIENYYDIKDANILEKVNDCNLNNVTPADLIKVLQSTNKIEDLFNKFMKKEPNDGINLDGYCIKNKNQVRINTNTIEGNKQKITNLQKDIKEFNKQIKIDKKHIDRHSKLIENYKKHIKTLDEKINLKVEHISKCNNKMSEIKTNKKVKNTSK